MIIGIAGTLGAGKGTVVRYLAEKGFAHYSSSSLLKEMLSTEGLPHIREHMSPLATRMRAKHPGGVPKKNHEKYLSELPENAVFEALHSKGEADFVRSIGGRVLGVDTDIHARYKRSVGRAEEKDRLSFEEFQVQSRIEDEGSGEDAARDNNIRAVLNEADFVVHNDGTLEELHAQVDAALNAFLDKGFEGA